MKAIILAAGRGSRMEALTDDRPKCLLELRGKSLLSRQLEALRAAGIQEIAIVTGYRSEMLEGRVERTFHNARWADTNMVSSLETASDWLESGPCIVSYSDIFFEASAVLALMKSEASLAVTFDPNWLRLWQDRFGDPLLDAETFRFSTSGQLTEIGQKPKTTAEVQGQYMGLLRFTPAGWAEMTAMRHSLPDETRDKMHMTGALQRLIERGRISIAAIAYEGDWGEVDHGADLSLYNQQGN